MKKLKLDAVMYDLGSRDNILYQRAIQGFIEAMTMEMIEQDHIDVNEDLNLTQDDFISSGNSVLMSRELTINLTENNHLNVKFTAYCNFDYNTVDETSVGLGAKGDICGIDTTWITPYKITLFTGDGCEFDLTDFKEIGDYLIANINID